MSWTEVDSIDKQVTPPSVPAACTDFRDDCLGWETTAESLGNIVTVSPTDPLADYKWIGDAVDAYHSVCTPANPYIIQMDAQLQWPVNSITQNKWAKVPIIVQNHPGGFVFRGKGYATHILYPFSLASYASDEIIPSSAAGTAVFVDNSKVFVKDCSLGFYFCTNDGTPEDRAAFSKYITNPDTTSLCYQQEPDQYSDGTYDTADGYARDDSFHNAASCTLIQSGNPITRDNGLMLQNCMVFCQWDTFVPFSKMNGYECIGVIENCDIIEAYEYEDDNLEEGTTVEEGSDGYGISGFAAKIYIKDSRHHGGAVASHVWIRQNTADKSDNPPAPIQLYFDNCHFRYTTVQFERGNVHLGYYFADPDCWVVYNNCTFEYDAYAQRYAVDQGKSIPTSSYSKEGPDNEDTLYYIGGFARFAMETSDSDRVAYDSTIADQGISLYLVNCFLVVDLSGVHEYLDTYETGSAKDAKFFLFAWTGPSYGSSYSLTPSNFKVYLLDFSYEVRGSSLDQEHFLFSWKGFDGVVLERY